MCLIFVIHNKLYIFKVVYTTTTCLNRLNMGTTYAQIDV